MSQEFELVPARPEAHAPWRINRIYHDADGLKCTEHYAEFWSEDAALNALRVYELLVGSPAEGVVLPNGVNLSVIKHAYGWTVDVYGEVHGLTAGDQGFEGTGIIIDELRDANGIKEYEEVLARYAAQDAAAGTPQEPDGKS